MRQSCLLPNQVQNPLQLGSICVCQKAMSSSSFNASVLQNSEFPFSLHQAVDSKNFWDPCRRKKSALADLPRKGAFTKFDDSRKRNESIVSNGDICIAEVEIGSDLVRLGSVSPSPLGEL